MRISGVAVRTLLVPYGKDLCERVKCPQSACRLLLHKSQRLCNGMESGTCTHLLANVDFKVVFWKSLLGQVS